MCGIASTRAREGGDAPRAKLRLTASSYIKWHIFPVRINCPREIAKSKCVIQSAKSVNCCTYLKLTMRVYSFAFGFFHRSVDPALLALIGKFVTDKCDKSDNTG